MARMRTIRQTMQYIKEKDSDTAITEWGLRQLVKCGKLKTHRAGQKYLINLDNFIEYLDNPPTEEEEESENNYGVLRRVL